VCFGGDCGTQSDGQENDYLPPCTSDKLAECDPKIYVSFLGTDSEG